VNIEGDLTFAINHSLKEK
jgi:hypothetical protein